MRFRLDLTGATPDGWARCEAANDGRAEVLTKEMT
jgi:hypothetical protein